MEIGTYLFTGRLCIERKLIGLSSRRRHIYCKYNNLIEKKSLQACSNSWRRNQGDILPRRCQGG